MKVYKPSGSSTFVVEYQNQKTSLLLVTSVAFFNSKIFPKYLKWKVQDDGAFLKSLITNCETNPNQQTIEALLEMEILYREMVDGKAQEGSSQERQKEVASSYWSNRNDISNQGFRSDDFTKAEVNSAVDESLASQPTIGDLVEGHRKQNGRHRNAWRKKTKK